MAIYFGRDIRLQVGDLEIASQTEGGKPKTILKVAFKAETSLSSTPNKASIQVFNLSEDSRSRVQAKALPVIIEAGYVGFTKTIYTGDTRFGQTSREGTDWITTIEAGDGGSAFKSARINESFGPGTSAAQILKTAGEALGLDLGNLPEKILAGSKRKAFEQWTSGGVLSGAAHAVLNQIAAAQGYQFSIQRGALLLLGPEETTQEGAFLLSPKTGLVGAPNVGEDGKVEAVSLLNGELSPGRRVRVESNEVDGFFRIDKATHTGDTWGPDWTTGLELRPVGG